MTEKPTLFDTASVPVLPERIRSMHAYYGLCEGRRCGTCAHLEVKRGRYLKCGIGRQTAGPGTDWRARWHACGKWEQR